LTAKSQKTILGFMKMHRILLYVLMVALLTSMPAAATTIIPAADPGVLARDSAAVFVARAGASSVTLRPSFISTETELVVSSVVKGPMAAGDRVVVTAPGGMAENAGWAVAGSPRFAEGKVYLVFADPAPNGRWRPRLLAEGVLQRETAADGERVLVPVKEAWALNRLGSAKSSAGLVPAPVNEARFLERLRRSLHDGATAWEWAPLLADSAASWSALKTAPTGCVFMTYSTSETPIRWKLFDDGGSVNLWADSTGDESVSGGGFAQVENAVGRWMGLPATDLDLRYQGPKDFTMSCSDDDSDAPPSSVQIVVFNDPCDDIDDLVNCGGTLAFGGPYFQGVHIFDDRSWYTAISWFVVVNNGAGDCVSDDTYELMITHELGHGLGFGHTADDQSMMYDTCCNEFDALDLTCTQYAYPGQVIDLPDDVTIPVVAHLEGVGGTPWRSDVSITNTDTGVTTLRLEYRPATGQVLQVSRTFAPMATKLFEDLVDTLFDAGNGRGSLTVVQNGPGTARPAVISRSYAERRFGNFGSGLPGDVAPQQGSVSMPGLFDNDAYRSNVSVTASTASDVTATFELFRSEEGPVGPTPERTVVAGQQNQWTLQDLFAEQAVGGGPMTVRVTLDAPGIANASLVDNKSTDTAVYLGKEPSEKWIVPVVAHNPGLDGTFWRSAVSLWNASATENPISMEFLPEDTDNSGGGIPTPQIVLAPFETLNLEDVAWTYFGIANGKGALVVTSDEPVTVTSRVFTDAEQGGTTGNRVRAVHDSAFTSGEVVLSGARLTGGFRTNVGLVTRDRETTFEVDLHRADGLLLDTAAVTVSARSMRQVPVEDLFPDLAVMPDPVASIVVRGDEAFLAYLAVIDGTSQDPIFVMSR